MMSQRSILKMTPLAAMALKEKVLSGDVEATKDFFLYSVWRKIRSADGFSLKEKITSFREIYGKLNIEVETHGVA